MREYYEAEGKLYRIKKLPILYFSYFRFAVPKKILYHLF